MPKKTNEVVKDPRLAVVNSLLDALDISLDDDEVKASLKKIRLPVMLLIQQYCTDNGINFTKTTLALSDILSQKQLNEYPPRDFRLIWAGLPVAEYIQQATQAQWFFDWRTGKNKSEKLSLLTAFLIELGNLDDIAIDKKIKLAKAFLEKTKSDKVWLSGKDGIQSIQKSLDNLSHIENILDDAEEIALLIVVCRAAAVISNYRTYVNSQTDLSPIFFGMFGQRTGKSNLAQFDKFLDSINKIVTETEKTPRTRIRNMITALNEIVQSLEGDISSETKTKVYNILINAASELDKVPEKLTTDSDIAFHSPSTL